MEIPYIPGLGFHPTDEELLAHYLRQRIIDHFWNPTSPENSHMVPDVDLYTMHPRDLPRLFGRLVNVQSNGREWVFFCAPKEKYRNSNRSKRTVPNVGYWKITSEPKEVEDRAGNIIGSKNILTFYQGTHSSKVKTDWILHEYHLNESCLGTNVEKMPFVICRLYNKGDKHDIDEDSTYYADESTESAHGSGMQGTAYSHPSAEAAPEEEMWNSLAPIQQLPQDLPSYHNNHYADTAFPGYSYGNNVHSSDVYPTPNDDEPSYYQQYQGAWSGSGFY